MATRSVSRLRRSFFALLPATLGDPRSRETGFLATPSSSCHFLTEAAILHGELDAGDLLKIFARSITEWASDADSSSEADEANDDNSVLTIEAAEAKAKPGKSKQAFVEMAAAETLATIIDK